MKKLLLLLSISGLSLAASAQQSVDGVRSSTDYAPSTSDSRNNGFGVKGGFNLANVYGDSKSTLVNRENLKTFMAGIYTQFGVTDKFSVQPELLYSRKGYRNPVNGIAINTPETRLDYVQVPVLLVYNFLDNVSVHVGPQVSLLTKAKNSIQDVSIRTAGYHSLDYGVVGGLEARIGPARVGGRYDLGLAKIRRESVFPGASDLHNQVFQVYVGVGFTN